MKLLQRCFFLITVLAFPVWAHAQDNIGLKFFGLSVHPAGDENAFLMPLSLDKKGVWVINLGGMLSAEKFIYQDEISVKAIQGLYSDCAARLGGFTHIGLRGQIFKTEKHSLYGGIGPTLVYRRNWYELPGYLDPNYFDGAPTDTWQYKFLWYGGEFEYAYVFSKKVDITVTFIPGFPKLVSLSIGAKYKFKEL